MEIKDLAYYEDHPEEATIEVLEQLANASMGVVSADEPAEQDVTEEAQAAPESVSSDVAAEVSEEAPILSRDGKHTIPFDVLSREREARQQAEKTVQDLNDRITQLQSQAGTGKVAAVEGDEPIISAEELDALSVDFPAFAKVVKAQMVQIASLESQVSAVSSKEAERDAVVQRTVQDEVRDAIDASPKLLKLEADPDAWETLVAIDNEFRSKPENQSLTFAERFEKVVQRYEAVYGPVDVPAVPKPTDSASVKAKAANLIKEQAAPIPRSLSDLPGGLPDAGSERERAENMSVTDMAAMMSKMTPAQIDNYLNQL